MFSRGTQELIDQLPQVGELDGEWARQRLSSAYLDVLAGKAALRRRGDDDTTRDIRRLIDALEFYVLSHEPEDEHRRACAFVAAEALDLQLHDGQHHPGATAADVGEIRLECGLLFAIAGFDANASAMAADVMTEEQSARGWALRVIADLLAQRTPNHLDPPAVPAETRWEELHAALWNEVGQAARAHHEWVRGTGDQESSPGLPRLTAILELVDRTPSARDRYSAPVLMAELLLAGLSAMQRRALRTLPSTGRLRRYIEGTSARRPLLWPAAELYARECLEPFERHAAVMVPTGSGKSAVAELAVARAVGDGWALYLAPTNALVSQIRRDLSRAVDVIGGELRAFVGGGEYSTEETLGEAGVGQVLVMTPEKAALALRQAPQQFAALRLLVVDECHLIGAGGNRGVVVELVLAEVFERAPRVVALLMSAMVSNAPQLAAWLKSATGRDAVAIEEPWRPTRTMRGVIGLNGSARQAAEDASQPALQARPNRVARAAVPLAAMVSLQGAWNDTSERADYAVVDLPASVEVEFRTRGRPSGVPGWRNRAAEAVTLMLANAGEQVLTFAPANKHEVISVGRAVARYLPEIRLPDEVIDHLAMAEFELGVRSEVGSLLRFGVATHSGALIEDERRASELAFGEHGSRVRVMVATTSLAQGLNLPATVVVVAGTQVGGGPLENARTARDLLNAVGRAGRPLVANRSLALVVPSRELALEDVSTADQAVDQARFLMLEDASEPLLSQLTVLLRRDPSRMAGLDAMTDEEVAAFTYLPVSAGPEFVGRILERTLGQFQRGLEVGPRPLETAEGLASVGAQFLGAAGAPSWLVQVAYLAGCDLRAVTGLFREVSRAPASHETPSGWAEALVRWSSRLQSVPRDLLLGIRSLPEPLRRDLSGGSAEPWERLAVCVTQYLAGAPLADLGQTAFGASREDGRRSSGDPLPKAIALVREFFSYRLSLAAGALVALAQVGEEHPEDWIWTLSPEETAGLSELPLALRLGCGTSAARAWALQGARGRRAANFLGGLFPPPPDLGGDAPTRNWIRETAAALREDPGPLGSLSDAAEAGVLAALRQISSQ